MIVRPTLLALFLSSTALAQDDDFDLDALMNEMDIGGNDKQGANLTYSGAIDHTAPDYAPGTTASITHAVGNISVRCTDRKGLYARMDYTIRGRARGSMERYGKSLGLSAWGKSNGGGVRTRLPGIPPGVTELDISLTVGLPSEARVRVSGGHGVIEVLGCHGSVSANNRVGDIYVTGTLSTFNISVPRGNARVDLSSESKVTVTNKIYAPAGDVHLRLPIDYDGKLYAKGGSVQVHHNVEGTETETLVQGRIGPSKTSVGVSAKGTVEINQPE